MYRRAEHLLTRHVAGETMIVPLRGRLADLRQIYALNPVAEFVWEFLSRDRDLEEICRAVVEEFEVDETQARADVRQLLDTLVSEGLVGEVRGTGHNKGSR